MPADLTDTGRCPGRGQTGAVADAEDVGVADVLQAGLVHLQESCRVGQILVGGQDLRRLHGRDDVEHLILRSIQTRQGIV